MTFTFASQCRAVGKLSPISVTLRERYVFSPGEIILILLAVYLFLSPAVLKLREITLPRPARSNTCNRWLNISFAISSVDPSFGRSMNQVALLFLRLANLGEEGIRFVNWKRYEGYVIHYRRVALAILFRWRNLGIRSITLGRVSLFSAIWRLWTSITFGSSGFGYPNTWLFPNITRLKFLSMSSIETSGIHLLTISCALGKCQYL